jgi:predicted protein tyrosine phosphatase
MEPGLRRMASPKTEIKILFICNLNMVRSFTAEHIYNDYPGLKVKSAGISTAAVVRIDRSLMDWADIVFVMEKSQKECLEKKFKSTGPQKKIIVLEIPDHFTYMDPRLVSLLRSRIDPYLSTLVN